MSCSSVAGVATGLREQLATAEGAGPDDRPRRDQIAQPLFWVLACEQYCYYHLGPFERAVTIRDEMLALTREGEQDAGWEERCLWVWTCRWMLRGEQGRYDEFLREGAKLSAYTRGLAARFGPRLGDCDLDESYCCYFIGVTLMQLGRYAEARGLIEQRITWTERNGRPGYTAEGLSSYAVWLWATSDYERGEAVAREELRLCQSQADRGAGQWGPSRDMESVVASLMADEPAEGM